MAREICARIMTRDATGAVRTLKDVCRDADMPKEPTVYQWLNRHPEFAELYARAREQRAEMIAEDVIEIADTEFDPQKARVRIDARKWAAAKMNPKNYGDKVETKTTHEAGESFAGLLTKIFTTDVLPPHATEDASKREPGEG
jgi:hypothetical protein